MVSDCSFRINFFYNERVFYSFNSPKLKLSEEMIVYCTEIFVGVKEKVATSFPEKKNSKKIQEVFREISKTLSHVIFSALSKKRKNFLTG